jgi:glycosyltransferase involved in cell wall biosynthesis
MNKKNLRIFINTNAMWSMSGYGQQAADLLPKIRDEGYPLAICNFFGSQGGKFEWEGITQYPIINHVYGSDALIHHAKDFGADVVFTLQDVWVLNPEDLSQTNHFIPITPIDHDPVPPAVLDKLRFAYRIITYSHFGYNELLRNGIFSTYIPHTVNTEIFKLQDKKERKRASGLPEDCFLVGMVAANKDNPPRKSFQEVLDAFVLFLKVEPKALLYIHSNPKFPGGFDFEEYAKFLGIREKLIFPNTYEMNFKTEKENMANIYATFDVLVAPSTSEGFGVPIIEAQSCGIPVITSRWTSMTELVKEDETGYLVDTIQKRWTGMGSYMAIPSIQSIYECLVKVHKKNQVEMGKKARTFIKENYDLNTIFENCWKPYLAELEEELHPVANEKEKAV